MEQIDIEARTRELREHISQFEPVSFITQYYYLLNTHLRTPYQQLKVKSPLRQVMYLLSLFLTTEVNGKKKVFDPITGNAKKIDTLLEEIERGYRYNYINGIKESELTPEIVEQHLLVANQTFVNYFSNGPLNFIEQEVEKILRIFMPYDSYILRETGCSVQDYLDFFDIIEFIEEQKLKEYFEEVYTEKNLKTVEKQNIGNKVSSEELYELVNAVENALYKLPYPKSIIYELMEDKQKASLLLAMFSCAHYPNHELLFYTNDCILMTKPIILLKDDFIIVPNQKQLIHAIYQFLFKICLNYDVNKRKIHEARDKFLEDKTYEIFNSFFDRNAKIYRRYYVDDEEKDMLILYRNTALIIECKANKYREPLRDPAKAYERIRDDFKKSIQYGYDQSWVVKQKFSDHEVKIMDKKGRIVDTINSRRYNYLFSIIVTAERFGQIQSDLDLLLEVDDNDDFPWSVFIDDLEIFLLTLKRKGNFYGEFINYLQLREMLHGRVLCSDELELCGSFLMDKAAFRKNCNLHNMYYISPPDMHTLFDRLYETGIGFSNERNLQRKLTKEDMVSKFFKKSLRLGDSKVVKDLRRKINSKDGTR